jgi:DNA (cytosine-5)-methyltransferase 1
MASRRIVSLFSGAGGLDFGFEAAGFKTRVALEKNPICCETLRKNTEWSIIEKAIENVQTNELLDAASITSDQVSGVIGGPPCQPFSKASWWRNGDSLRFSDPRASTIKDYLRVVEDILPDFFLFENVPGFAYAGKDEGLVFLLNGIMKINRKHKTNYTPSCKVLNAADYGVPQIRHRFFLIAQREGIVFDFPKAMYFPQDTVRQDGDSYYSAWDAIGDIENNFDDELLPKGYWGEIIPSIPPGNNYLFHTSKGDGLPLFGDRTRYWSFLLKLDPLRPSWTISAQPGPSVGPFHWMNRRLSINELQRLQTFPSNVLFIGTQSSIIKQIGNAVPSLLAEQLALEISKQFYKTRPRSATLLPLRRSGRPNIPPIQNVAERYLKHVGVHQAHPGAGKGKHAKKTTIEP